MKRLKVIPKNDNRDSDGSAPPPFLSPQDIVVHAQCCGAEDEKPVANDDSYQSSTWRYHAMRLLDRTIEELIGLCKGLMAGGVINTDEAVSYTN